MMSDQDVERSNRLGFAALKIILQGSNDVYVRLSACEFVVANTIVNLGADSACWQELLQIFAEKVGPILAQAALAESLGEMLSEHQGPMQ